MNLAPVVLFVYNRPWHTRQTLEALSRNFLADQSELIVFADGPKPNTPHDDIVNINSVRMVVREKKWCKNVYLMESEVNRGLADSIISGVTKIVKEYGRIIVLEDDIVTSPGFLKYMNEALDLYSCEEKVMHISGYMHPVKGKLPETFFYNVNSCWGWGTWSRQWEKFNNNSLELKFKLIHYPGFTQKKFNRGQGMDFWNQLEDNLNGRIKSWAIFWHIAIFLNNGYSLHPGKSLVRNIGMDNSGIHCGEDLRYINQVITGKVNVEKIRIRESNEAIKLMNEFVKQHSKIKKIKQFGIKLIKQFYKI